MELIWFIAVFTSVVFGAVVFFGFCILPSCIVSACASGVVAGITGPHQPFYFDELDKAVVPMAVAREPIPPERALAVKEEQPALVPVEEESEIEI